VKAVTKEEANRKSRPTVGNFMVYVHVNWMNGVRTDRSCNSKQQQHNREYEELTNDVECMDEWNESDVVQFNS
jgi:hypothetical protein